MTYPTVTNTVLTVSGLPLANAPVNISLSVGGFNTDDNNEMNSGVTVYTNASGVWSATLKPNALINPNGTYYTVSEPNGAKWTAIVPNGAGPYLLVNILTATPPNPTPGAPFVTSVVGQTGAVTGAQIVADSTVAGTFVHQTGNESIAGVKTFSSSPVVPNNAALDNSTKTANTAYVDTAVATQHAADTATYVPWTNSPAVWSGRKNGLLYNGTDETATVTSILSAMATFGGGQLVLEAIVRCDSQIQLPTYTTTDNVLHQVPIRISGQIAQQTGQWPQPATPTAPSAVTGGMDLRYAGRTDSGCSITLGSTFITNTAAVAADRGNIVVGAGIPDQCWIIGSIVGSGWVVTAPARATNASVSLTNFGGRIQGFGYGALEIDHLQFCNLGGTASSAPFGLTTGPSVNVHENTFYGYSTKYQTTCDEDPWVFGGPGQGTYLTTGLSSGTPVTSLAVAALPVALNAGVTLVVAYGTSSAATVTVAAGGAAYGATTININSFTPSTNFATNTSVFAGQAPTQIEPHAFNVPSAPFQGYKSYIIRNQFHRIRRVSAGLFTTSVHINENGFMHDCGSNLAVKPSTLTSGLTSGNAYTSLSVSALQAAVNTGDVVQVGVGPLAQETIASAPASAGATTISVNSFTSSNTVATGVVVFNSTAGIGAAVDSYGDLNQVNSLVVRENRFEMLGYTHATRFVGGTIHSVISANDIQDTNTNIMIAGHRFDRGSLNNTVIQGLASIPLLRSYIDDWATSANQPNQFVTGAVQPNAPFIVGGQLIAKSTSTYAGGVKWQNNDVDKWLMYFPPGSSLFIRDAVNGVMALQFIPGSGTTGQAKFAGIVQAVSLRPVSVVPTFSATQSFDQSVATIHYLTMTGNITSWSVTNPRPDCEVEIHFIQDATGSRTLSGSSGVKWAGGAPTLTTTANKRDIFKFRSDAVGTMWETSRSMNVG